MRTHEICARAGRLAGSAVALAVALSACGGGGSDAGVTAVAQAPLVAPRPELDHPVRHASTPAVVATRSSDSTAPDIASTPQEPTSEDAPEDGAVVVVEEFFDAATPRSAVRRRARQFSSAVIACGASTQARGYAIFWLDIATSGEAELAATGQTSPGVGGRTADCAVRALSTGGWPSLDRSYRIRVRFNW